MENPHNIKIGQHVALLRINHHRTHKSDQFNDVNIIDAVITKIGRKYFVATYGVNEKDMGMFRLDNLCQNEDNYNWRRYQFFPSREAIKDLEIKEELKGRINRFLDKYRYGLVRPDSVSMEEINLWIELIEKVEALNNGNKL